MRSSLPLALAGAVLLSSVSAHDVDQQHQQHARHLQQAQHGAEQARGMAKLVRRQAQQPGVVGGLISAASSAVAAVTAAGDQTTSAATTPTAATVAEQPETSAAVTPSVATTSAAEVAATSPTVVASSSTTTTTTTSAAPTITSATLAIVRPTSSSAPASSAPSASKVVETLTSTSTNSASLVSGSATSSSSAATSSATSEENKGGSSGIAKPTLIVIIVVASSIALVAAIWTIIRKTAFSPSRRFENKLAPIDFDNTDNRRNSRGSGDAILAHERSNSVMSGARPGEMSERWAGQGGYAPSLGRSDSGKGSLRDAYAPQSIPYNPQPSPAAYGGPQYYQQPYHGGSQYSASLPGYPQEQAFGYSNLQRGASSRTDLSRNPTAAGLSGRGTPAGAYDYAAQARAQSRGGHHY